MKITWINHASYLLEYRDVKLLCDPWLEGRVFNQSWALLSPTKFRYKDFKNVTHIWFSHEHPDHFFPPNIQKIPVEYRENITVLYQETIDHKVREFCSKLGFKQIFEMVPLKEYHLGNDLSVINDKVKNDTDSWLLVKTPEGNLLNLNDCIFESVEELSEVKSLAGEIDVMLTQFSYACWVGNPEDVKSKKSYAEEKLQEMKGRIEVFKPRYTIPFASYVWFCHPDNFHMNQEANNIKEVYQFIGNLSTEPVVMYPGDEWFVGGEHHSLRALEKYQADQRKIPTFRKTIFQTVPVADLEQSAQENIKRCLSKNNARKLRSFKPMYVFLNDHQKAYSFSYRDGLQVCPELSEQQTDVSFHSQNLKYCFDFDWGYDTIHVAGSFKKPELGNYRNFEEYQWVAKLNNTGRRMDGLIRRALKKVLKF